MQIYCTRSSLSILHVQTVCHKCFLNKNIHVCENPTGKDGQAGHAGRKDDEGTVQGVIGNEMDAKDTKRRARQGEKEYADKGGTLHLLL